MKTAYNSLRIWSAKRNLFLTCVLLFAFDQPIFGQDKLTEVRFANGDAVRLVLIDENIDVVTKYGKLSVPLTAIQHVEFGVHLLPDVAKKVDSAINHLGSLDSTEREDAQRNLIALGASAYPSLLRAIKSTDAEVSRRAEKALAAIREALPESELRPREDDVIATVDFTIVGRIATTTFRANSPNFGKVQIPISELRQLHPLDVPGQTKVSVTADDGWHETEIMLGQGMKLFITATGSVDLYPQTPKQYMSTPKGYGITPAPGFRCQALPLTMRPYAGALFGRIGTGEAFYIGERYEGAPGQGKLSLCIVQSQWNNASVGQYNLKVTTRN